VVLAVLLRGLQIEKAFPQLLELLVQCLDLAIKPVIQSGDGCSNEPSPRVRVSDDNLRYGMKDGKPTFCLLPHRQGYSEG
jgi:hypothetical protein